MSSGVNCPMCASPNVHAEKRGWSAWTGFVGSGKIMLTCLKCGHRFAPGQGPVAAAQAKAEANRIQREHDDRVAQLLAQQSGNDDDLEAAPAMFSGLPEFEIIGTDTAGKKVRFTVAAEDADAARFVAAERDITVLGLRRAQLPRASAATEAEWFVEGRSIHHVKRTARVRAASEDEASQLAMAHEDIATVERVWPVGQPRPA